VKEPTVEQPTEAMSDGSIEVAPGLRMRPGSEEVDLILPDDASLAIAFTPEGARVLVSMDGTHYALEFERWNQMLDDLALASSHLGLTRADRLRTLD
jgi:hypothetical protein